MKHYLYLSLLLLLCETPAFAQVPDSCANLRPWRSYSPQSSEEYSQQYDSLRKYIESCPNNEGSFHAFTKTTADVQEYLPYDTLRYDRYRDWLISVLYLNTTEPYYFCACVEAIAGTYVFGKAAIPNAWLAVVKYLLDNPICNQEGLKDSYNNTLRSRHDTWVSRGSDPKVPEDTVLPSLDKLGLGLLL